MKIAYGKLLLGIAVLCGGCREEWEGPRYSEVPSIQLRGVRWVRTAGSGFDTLHIEIGWQDGDGDLGVSIIEADTNPTYFPYKLVKDYRGRLQYFNSATDTFDCTNYVFPAGNNPLIIGNDTITDTVRVIRNKYRINFHVSTLFKENGEFVEFDWLKEFCRPPLGGVFPRINSFVREKITHDDDGPFVIYQESPWRGVITFAAPSLVFRQLFVHYPSFAQDTMKVRVYINDRALNESNVVESEPITVEEIDW